MPNQSETRSQRVQRMLQKRKPRLTRQLGKRNLFNNRRNSNISRYSGINTNENNLQNYLASESNQSNSINNLLNTNSGFTNTFSAENQRYLNMYMRNLQNRNNAAKAYRQRKTMSGRWNRFKERMRNQKPTRRLTFPRRKTPSREVPASVYLNMI